MLETVLRRHPNHPGANHYYIHAVEASPTPERALASAARLETLVPGAGHLVHMPTHIYMHTGDLDRIASLNQKAADADEHYFSLANPEGVYPFMYYAHNLHFVVVGHLATGRYDDSRAAAKKMADLAAPHVAEMAPMAEWVIALPTLVDVRFQKWDAILAAPKPPESQTLARAFDSYARAVALQMTGKKAEASAAAAAFEADRAKVKDEMLVVSFNSGPTVLAVLSELLKAQLAPDLGAAEPHFKAAIAGQDAFHYDEPAPIPWSVRESYGAALLAGGRAVEAEQVFRADLARNARSGRSLVRPDDQPRGARPERRGRARSAGIRERLATRDGPDDRRRASLSSYPEDHRMRRAVIACTVVVLTSTALIGQDAHSRISLWPNGAPGSEARKNEPEQAQDYWVKNIHDPSITVYLPPPEKATGAAVVVVPGGGHRLLVFKAEGLEPAEYLASLGVAAFALKYRLAREDGSTYSIEKDAKADAYRAMRLVRSRAAEWHIDPHRIGIMGFSAGGELVGLVAYGSGDGDPQAADPIDRVNGRPDFTISIYPGPLGRAGVDARDRTARVPRGGVGRPVLRGADDQAAADVSGRRRPGGSAHPGQGRPRVQHGPAIEAEVGEYVARATRGLDER